MLREKVKENWYLIPILTLGIYFIYRLIDQAQMVSNFPLDLTNDLSSLLAQLFFLAKCGFHKICPYWYNGYEVLKYYAPGWFYFALPIYLLTKNILFSAYLSLILMYVFSFIFLLILAKSQKFSITKTLLFFFLFFANPITIGNFIRLGRLHSMFAFMLLIPFFIIILYYKDKEIDKKFFLFFIPIYTLVLLSHQQEFIIFHILILSLFLVKTIREKIKLILAVLAGILLSSFWLFSFIKSALSANMLSIEEGKWILQFTGQWLLTNIAGIILPLILVILFYLFYTQTIQNKKTKEFIFYLPVLVLAILFLTRITAFIPVLEQIEPDAFMMFFLFISIFLFLKIKYYPVKIKKLIPIALIILVLLSVIISVLHTPFFIKHTLLEEDTLDLLNEVEGSFMILHPISSTSYPNAYYSYAPIYLNLSTPAGWAEQAISSEYKDSLTGLPKALEEKDCKKLLSLAKKLNLHNILTYNEDCSTLSKCGFKKISEKQSGKEKLCLYNTKSNKI